ncbi:1-phosphofructokinase family hexose kinase [Glaciihabitans sp. dw_435]|uniref:1-phosphofructokinase family hexose kinase n=1 Tax=Glaciihabitans sp. dw_435 TaxID=2720081 RepID=UPI001BD4A3F0|nr:PfkB family carbohydrate kinase [Glaciihabitans sp. dw_435]
MADVVIVTPNPAIDVTYRVDDQTPGETHRVREISRRPGGKGINVARGLEALGHSTMSVLPLGGASGAWISDALTDLGLAHSITAIDGLTRTTVTVTDDASHPTVFTEAGPIVAASEWDALIADTARLLTGARMLIISGSLPPAADTTIVSTLVARARDAGVPVLVDASGDALLAAAAAGADVVKPNQQELLEATHAGSPDEAITQLLDSGARTVVVSRGVDGLIATTTVATAVPAATALATATAAAPASATATPAAAIATTVPARATAFSATAAVTAAAVTTAIEPGTHSFAVPAISGVHGNPTGAGDAATAGLAAALLDGLSLEDALRWAAALGAAAVLRPVAGEVDIDAFHRFLRPTPIATSPGTSSPDSHSAPDSHSSTPDSSSAHDSYAAPGSNATPESSSAPDSPSTPESHPAPRHPLRPSH